MKLILCLVVLLSSFISVQANSAQTKFSGVDYYGTFMKEEESPILVEHEELVLDIPEFPQSYYKSVTDIENYSAKVSATYTFYNPSDYTITATLLFPFGTYPDYSYYHDETYGPSTFYNDTTKYEVLINHQEIQKEIRYTYTNRPFNLEDYLHLFHKEYVKDDFYHPELKVTKYRFKGNGNTAYMPIPQTNSRLYFDSISGTTIKDDQYAVTYDAKEEEYCDLYVIGNPLEVLPSWSDSSITLENQTEMTFLDFVLLDYDETSGINIYDWYNSFVTYIHKNTTYDYNLIYNTLSPNDFSYLMRWYEYEITLQPKERITNTVIAPLYPSIDESYDPAIYEYTYLLSPASSWKEFNDLNITINTPYTMIETELGTFNKIDTGYQISFDQLPDQELVFSLSMDEHPLKNMDSFFYLMPVFTPVILIILVFFFILYILKKKLNKKRGV